ncbi:MAG: lamin tail domain-containing protein, partial [Deltaproteobacteria bacterium]
VGWTSGAGTDYDSDGCQDGTAEETDDDNDGVLNDDPDACPQGNLGWTSTPGTDYDGDGCEDGTAEETDDDNDGVANGSDGCPQGNLGWTSTTGTDYDSDGCQDGTTEETDDDNDGVVNTSDGCPQGNLLWTSTTGTDYDSDGCEDGTVEETDDDNDGVINDNDGCPQGELGWTSDGTNDHDSDGCKDDTEDSDDDNDGVADGSDSCATGDTGWTADGTTDYDSDGCKDDTEDLDDDNDGVADDHPDLCPKGELGWTSDATTDHDGDGCKDATEDTDDDNDTILDDGDSSGTPGDNTCASGATTGCDDNCPLDPNADQADGDGDGVGTACDNCPAVSNVDQIDLDADGIGDACDSSIDTNGNNCVVPRTLALDASESGDTTSATLTNAFSVGACPDLGGGATNDGGKDEVWSFTPTATGEYVVTLTPTTNNLFLYAFSDSACGDAECFGTKDGAGAGAAETLTLGVVAGQTYYIVVDSAAGAEDTYGISMTQSCGPPPAITELFISEYVNAGQERQAIEIFNGTSGTINLAGYTLRQGKDGGALDSATVPYNLGDHDLAPGATWVVCRDGGHTVDDAQAGTCDDIPTANTMDMTGDDAIALTLNDGTVLDIVGVAGAGDPGNGWDVAGTTEGTDRHTLVRKSTVFSGTTDWAASAGTTVENSQWIVFPDETLSNLGSHTLATTDCPVLGTAATSTAVTAGTNSGSEVVVSCMDGYAAVGIHGETGTNADAIALDCQPLFLNNLFFGLDPDPTTLIGSGISAAGPYSCGAGEGIVGIETSYGATAFHKLQGTCLSLGDIAALTDPATGGRTDGAIQGTASTAGDTLENTRCAAGSIVTGLRGFVNAGGELSEIAVDCRPLP